jgi:hypothetical protein
LLWGRALVAFCLLPVDAFDKVVTLLSNELDGAAKRARYCRRIDVAFRPASSGVMRFFGAPWPGSGSLRNTGLKETGRTSF